MVPDHQGVHALGHRPTVVKKTNVTTTTVTPRIGWTIGQRKQQWNKDSDWNHAMYYNWRIAVLASNSQ